PEPRADDHAYLLFTSGSTGRPKGVLVRQAHVRAFLDAIAERYDLDENDRLSQMFDLTFDLSAFDMFAGWERGACVCCPRAGELLKPSSFIRSAGLTVWFSVPSVAMLLHRFRVLTPNAFPSLRLSLFCGEAFPATLARGWALAAAPDGPLMFLGRLDTQIKVLGHRVELEEVEAVIHEEAAVEAIAVGWPRTATGAAGIVALVAGRHVDPADLRQRLAARLPDYM